jgi:hypothetical protein
MIENHEILCPKYIECDICETKRNEINRSRITKLFGIEDDIHILSKHFYHLTISVKPTRETYHHFSLDPLKRTGRELINGLSSMSSVSNRKWWSMFVDSGIRYYSVFQEEDNDFPTFNNHFLFFSDKDNLDVRMNLQLKCRLKKISKHLNFKFDYLGVYNLDTIKESIKIGVSINCNSTPVIKLGEDVLNEIYKIRDQRPIPFGIKINNKTGIQQTINSI